MKFQLDCLFRSSTVFCKFDKEVYWSMSNQVKLTVKKRGKGEGWGLALPPSHSHKASTVLKKEQTEQWNTLGLREKTVFLPNTAQVSGLQLDEDLHTGGG